MMDQPLNQFMVDQSHSKCHNDFRIIRFHFYIFRLGDPFGKELTIFNFEDIFRNGQGAIQAKYVRAFGEFKMPMGVEIMSVSHIFNNIS